MNVPMQDSSRARGTGSPNTAGFDMRDWLNPRRMTVLMWDWAFLTRHMKGDSFEDYDRVLNEAVERGYNTLRLDPIPQMIDLTKPERIFSSLDTHQPFMPWARPDACEGPLGAWLIEFVEKMQRMNLSYALSAWGNSWDQWPDGVKIQNLQDITTCWKTFLTEWKKRFGFDNCVYVDVSNEYPYFLSGHYERIMAEHNGRWSPEWNAYTRQEVNGCLRELRQMFPEVRFILSLHGDVNWIDLDLELDAMDIHFYADADQRFTDRTLFDLYMKDFFVTDSFFKDFSDRCMKGHKIMAPAYRARQRAKLSAFSAWSQESGIPLLTSESWASWNYIDHPDLDWSWLLEWAEWSVEDAIEYKMWGWTPHNYCQPQFENWKDVTWHRRLTEKFLRS